MNAEIFHIMRERIVGGEAYPSGQLPSEFTLMDEFGVSRHTVRAALQKLVDEGLIERKRGFGTVIVKRDPPMHSWAISTLDPFGSEPYEADLLSASQVVAGLFPDMADLFGVKHNECLFLVVMVAKYKDKPLAFSMLFSRPEFGERVPPDMIKSDYLLNLLEKYCGLRATHTRQTTSAAMPSPMVCGALGITEDEPVLIYNRSYYSASGELFEHARVHIPGDTQHQVLDFYRDDRVVAPSKVTTEE